MQKGEKKERQLLDLSEEEVEQMRAEGALWA
jgi:hypothetical protein